MRGLRIKQLDGRKKRRKEKDQAKKINQVVKGKQSSMVPVQQRSQINHLVPRDSTVVQMQLLISNIHGGEQYRPTAVEQ